jgi:hypothetical protein
MQRTVRNVAVTGSRECSRRNWSTVSAKWQTLGDLVFRRTDLGTTLPGGVLDDCARIAAASSDGTAHGFHEMEAVERSYPERRSCRPGRSLPWRLRS